MEGKKGCTLLMRLAALCDESVMKKTAQQNAGAETGDVYA